MEGFLTGIFYSDQYTNKKIKGPHLIRKKNNVKWMVFFTQGSQTGEPHRADGQHWGGGLCTLGPGPGPPL